MKTKQSLLATAIFILITIIVYHTHINYFKVDVVFYAAIFDALLASVIAGSILFGLSFFKALGFFEKTQLIIIWLITGYALAISVPTVIDRSLSFYILEKIQQRGGGIRQDAFEEVFIKEYVKEHHLVEVRLTEQLESGTIMINNQCVLLTPKGQLIASLSREFRKYWLPKKRLLLGDYSDALIDPFKSKIKFENYTCQQ